ncbi:MAG: hypothetical protein KAX49_06250 [Halanaerobiales bacterium]|nr:hypothetical protein [Halanaerobiales bacterium]
MIEKLLLHDDLVEILSKNSTSDYRPELGISLDGGSAEHHDFLRGKGTFKETLKKLALFTENLSDLKEESIKYYKIIDESIPHMIQLFKKSSLAKQGYSWDDLHNMILFAFCLDLGILKYLYKNGVIQKRENGYYLWAFSSKIVVKNPLGIKFWPSEAQKIGIGEFWHPQIKRNNFGLDYKDLEVLAKIHLDEKNFSCDSKKLLLLNFHGLTLEDDTKSGYKLAIPIFDYENTDEFMDYLDQVSLKIVEEVTLPVLERYDSMPIYKHGIVRLLMEYAADLLVDQNKVLPFSKIKKAYQKNWFVKNLYTEDSIIHHIG